MPRVYMRFEWLDGWRVSFLDGDTTLPRTLRFESEEQLVELAGRAGALKTLADRQGLEHAIRLGRGGLHLDLSYEQHSVLERNNP